MTVFSRKLELILAHTVQNLPIEFHKKNLKFISIVLRISEY